MNAFPEIHFVVNLPFVLFWPTHWTLLAHCTYFSFMKISSSSKQVKKEICWMLKFSLSNRLLGLNLSLWRLQKIKIILASSHENCHMHQDLERLKFEWPLCWELRKCGEVEYTATDHSHVDVYIVRYICLSEHDSFMTSKTDACPTKVSLANQLSELGDVLPERR